MKLTEDQARERLIAQREARDQFERLQERYWRLRETMTPEAILVVWFLLGDKCWDLQGVE